MSDRIAIVLPSELRGDLAERVADMLEAAACSDAEIHYCSEPSSAPMVADSVAANRVLVLGRDCLPLPGLLRRTLGALDAEPDAACAASTLVRLPDGGRLEQSSVEAQSRDSRSAKALLGRTAYLRVYGAEAVGAVLVDRSRAGTDVLPAVMASPAEAVSRWRLAETACLTGEPGCVLDESRAGLPRRSRSIVRIAAAAAAVLRGRIGPRRLAGVVSNSTGFAALKARWRDRRERAADRLRWQFAVPALERLHDRLLARFADAELPPLPAATGGRTPRIAYYTWRYPVLSETFIQRELEALCAAGLEARMIADLPGAGSGSDPALVNRRRETEYLLPIPAAAAVLGALSAGARGPRTAWLCLRYVIGRRYDTRPSLGQDVRVFLKAAVLARRLRQGEYTQVHAPWGDTNAFVAMIASRLAGVEFSVQFRAQDLHRSTLAYLIDEKIRHARFVVTNTDYNLRCLEQHAVEADRGKLHRIYNGLDLDRFAYRERRGPERDAPLRLLTVARLIEPKGLPYLFEAVRLLIDRGRLVECTVVGGPELPLYVNDLVEIRLARTKLGLEDRVELTGALPFAEVLLEYAEADIFALPCVVGKDGSNDITPNVYLEAMASGLAPVGTTLTAIPELIEDGVSGLLVEPNNAAALADAIERLMDDPALRVTMGAAARKRIEDRFNVKHNISRYVDLFGAP